jgi:hypothetical protein
MHSNVNAMTPEVSGPAGGIPEATVARLPVYLRALYILADRGVSTVASEELAAAAGVNSAKLRKDLSHLGSGEWATTSTISSTRSPGRWA